MLLSNEDLARINVVAQQNGGPKAVSLSGETHLFHFHDTDWRRSPVIFINKNGNHARLVRGGCGSYFLFKTWNRVDGDTDDWTYTGQAGPDPEKLVAKVTHGPTAGKSELLCLLPREACARGRRQAVWRFACFTARFDLPANKFCLTGSDWFHGKLWESSAAADFAAKVVAEMDLPLEAPNYVENPFVREAALAAAVEDLQDNPLWGAFG